MFLLPTRSAILDDFGCSSHYHTFTPIIFAHVSLTDHSPSSSDLLIYFSNPTLCPNLTKRKQCLRYNGSLTICSGFTFASKSILRLFFWIFPIASKYLNLLEYLELSELESLDTYRGLFATTSQVGRFSEAPRHAPLVFTSQDPDISADHDH